MIEQICLDQLCLDSAQEIFETMIFMDLLETDEPDVKIEGDAVLSSITFKGSLEGCLALCCGKDCAMTIAMNMLGFDGVDAISNEDMCDALGEVANMVMGSLKKRLHDYFGDLHLSIPMVINGHKLKESTGEGTKYLRVKVKIEDQYPAELWLTYREKTDE